MEFVAILLVVTLILLVVFIAKVSNLSGKLTDVDWELKKLKGRVDDLEQPVPAGRKRHETTSPSQPVAPQRIASVASVTPRMEPVPASPPKGLYPQGESKPSRTREEWEALIGGKILNRIGALALIIGIGYFLKYAFDNDWINETTRVLMGAAIGFVCLAGAYRSHQKGFKVFAQGIVGAGISILYLSVYASFNFYYLVPQWVAFLLMSIVTVIALAQGLYYGSVAVALLGWAGGFLTPFLLSTGVANEAGLFIYVALLDAGLLAITYKKQEWWVLEPLTFAGTWILYLSWYAEFYQPADLGITIVFIAVFWALFYALMVLQPSPAGPALVSRGIVAAANAFAVFVALYAIIDVKYHDWMGLVIAGLGVIYLATLLVRTSQGNVSTPEQMHYVLSSIGFLVMASGIQWEGFEAIIAWCAEAGFLVWISTRLKIRYAWLTAAGIFGFSVLKFISTPGSFFYYPASDFSPLVHSRAIALIVGALSLSLGSLFLEKVAEKKDLWVVNVFRVFWPAALFLLIGLETNDLFRQEMTEVSEETASTLSFERLMWIGTLWAGYSVPLVWIGIKFRHVPVMICGFMAALIGGALVLVRGMVFEPVESFEFITNIRASALLVVAGLLLIQERLTEWGGNLRDWLPDIRSTMQMAIVLLVFGLLTGETLDFFRKEISLVAEDAENEISTLSNLQQLSLSGIWLVYSAVLMAGGLWRKLRALRIAAFVLFGLTILKIFLYDLSFLDSLYRIFSFIGLGLILLAVSYAYQRYRDIIFGTKEG